ncbi:hypothetical protein Tco_0904230 [Tanacetum coccineum]
MEAIIKTVQSQLQQKKEQLASLKEQAISIEKEEKVLQSLTQNLETTSEPIETSTNTQKQPEPVTSTSKTQQSSSPSPGERSQTAKLNAINRMKNVPTIKEREEMRRPSVENFQRLTRIVSEDAFKLPNIQQRKKSRSTINRNSTARRSSKIGSGPG